MTVQELKSAFESAYGKTAEAVLFFTGTCKSYWRAHRLQRWFCFSMCFEFWYLFVVGKKRQKSNELQIVEPT